MEHSSMSNDYDSIAAIRQRLQNSVNWMMEGRNTGPGAGVADFKALIRLIDRNAGATPDVVDHTDDMVRMVRRWHSGLETDDALRAYFRLFSRVAYGVAVLDKSSGNATAPDLSSVAVPRELLCEARDNCQASIAEDGISADRKEYRVDLHKRLTAALAGVSVPRHNTFSEHTPMDKEKANGK
jgi:hypothetical protein